ncbi:recombinase family protein [Guptibacillus hwajinpoensis]|uniref:recombinase family protein n=1 Tax=Guptibacillus hwajinpoensis TaxID=208199 RepID=UPI001CFC90CD|nr:recombinase family protein [Pseudalkalibacillus hwajinpoensis]WLR60178.1 recombinase family protein [Pseudalkalibacillus hwajinpoensis]
MNSELIKYVAIYLRKSRGDLEKDLTKHKQMLTEIAEEKGWQYKLYYEIGSADNIQFRPKMQELLLDITNKLFDAVLVMDFDRLGRGEKVDQANIESTFRESNTLLITPHKVFDLHNETDAMLSDVQGMLSRFEYIQIKKRLNQGKKIGAKFGNWTNGTPPFPYYYDHQSKSLKVDETKRIIFDELKQRVLEGIPLHTIAVQFNRKGYRTNRSKLWTDVALHRLLTNEVHLGKIIYGKTSGSGHINKKTSRLMKRPRENWIIANDSHEPVLSLEEFSEIQSIFCKNKLLPKRARSAVYPLTGLIKCGKCGSSMNFTKKNAKDGVAVYIKKCQKPDWMGNRCGNRGIKEEVILSELRGELERYYNELSIISKSNQKSKGNDLLEILNKKVEKQKRSEKALARTRELYELGEYSRTVFTDRSNKWQMEINNLKNEINQLNIALYSVNELNNNELSSIILSLINFISHRGSSITNLTQSKVNGFNKDLRKIIKSIDYLREEDHQIKVHFSI